MNQLGDPILMTDHEFYEAVVEMRRWQDRYDRSRSADVARNRWSWERRVDQEIKRRARVLKRTDRSPELFRRPRG